jgi:hypothetical protein
MPVAMATKFRDLLPGEQGRIGQCHHKKKEGPRPQGEGLVNPRKNQPDRCRKRLPFDHALPSRADLAGPAIRTDRRGPRKAQTKKRIAESGSENESSDSR